MRIRRWSKVKAVQKQNVSEQSYWHSSTFKLRNKWHCDPKEDLF